jgi:hypothetical protein
VGLRLAGPPLARDAFSSFARRIDVFAGNPFSKKIIAGADRVRLFTTGVISLIVALQIGVPDARAAS